MTSPDSNADTPPSKYTIQIGEGQGIVIGDNAQVTQLYGTPPEPQVDLTAAEAAYRQQVVDTYKWLNFSGFDTPDLSLANVPLEEVFVRLSLTVEKVIRETMPVEKATQAERGKSKQRERVITVQEPIELGQALSTHLLLVGEPGAGKSTLLHWLAVTFAQERQREPKRVGPSADADRLPVLVELGRLPDRYVKPEGGETPNWIQLLPEYLTAQMAFTNTPPQLLIRALADGRCLLLFDGLDEVADRQVRARLARSLAELVRLSPGNRVIIGSRPAGVSESEGALHPHFQRCQIERFTPEDVQRFFRFWYALDRSLTPEQQHDDADALYARVQATPETLRLASTPLLSTVLVLIWRNEGNLPERRVDLYERCCRVLIKHWEAHHDVAYQGALVGMHWEDHLGLLTPLAYTVHSHEQRTSATREELVPLLAQALQTAGYANEQAATREAKQFLDALGLRSGLLQYIGDDRYGFPHLTFQEYLAARYIAVQPDPEYIDLVMEHLHEAWWQQVHLLTIAHLGSGSVGVRKASALILTILHVYVPPRWILRSSSNPWLRLPLRFALIILGISIMTLFKGLTPAFIILLCIAAIAGLIQFFLRGLGKLLPQMQLDRRIAWILARELELAAKGYAECACGGTTTSVGTTLSAQAVSLAQHIIYDEDRYEEQGALLAATCQLLRRQGDETAVSALLKIALYDRKRDVRQRAATCLGQVGAGNEAVVSALLEALHEENWYLRKRAAESLGQVGVGNAAVVSGLLEALRDDTDWFVRVQAAESLGQVGVGNAAVISALLEALHEENWGLREQAAASLGQVGAGNEAVISALLETLHDENWGLRKQAAASLGQVGAGNEAVISALLEMALHEENVWAQRQAAASLGQVGAGNEAVISTLLEALHEENVWAQRQAAASLGQVGAGNEAVISTLLEALHEENWGLREQAAASLGEVGAGNEAVLRALLEALHDTKGDVREQAAASLGQVGAGNEEVLRALLEALHDTKGKVREQAAASLGQVGAGNEEVLRALLEALHDTKGYVQGQAAASLVRIEIKETTQLRQVLVTLNHCLYDWHTYVRQAALVSIRQLLDGRPIPGYRWEPLRKR